MVNEVFICGCGHSGTSLVLAILASHSKCFGIKVESGIFLNNDPASVQKEKFSSYKSLAENSGKQIIIEKTPRHVYRINRIQSIFPEAKIILCVRNPLDVTASFKKRFGQTNPARWISDNRELLKWIGKRNTFLLKYEDLVDQPTGILTNLCGFLGIDFEEGMLNFHQQNVLWFGGNEAKDLPGRDGAEHIALRNWQLRQPITDQRGEWRNRIGEDEYNLIKTQTQTLAAELGFHFEDSFMKFQNKA